jgi:hypothetical protein
MRTTRPIHLALILTTALVGIAACQGGGAPSTSDAAPADNGASAPGNSGSPVDVEAEQPGSGVAAGPTESAAQLSPTAALSRRSWAELGVDEPLYEPWARVLAEHVDDEGLVDYAGLKADPSGFSEPAQIAFWINAYNATVIHLTVERYPIDSVREVGALFGLVGGFFKQEIPIAGQDRHLDNIEHDILRPTYDDARIHWTLVCGAFGCPRLLRRPYVAADLDPLLTELSFEFLSNPRALQIDRENNTLHLSSYFDWYGGDFEAEAGDVVDYILQFAAEGDSAWIRANRDAMSIRFIDYDWTLNDQEKGPRNRRAVSF